MGIPITGVSTAVQSGQAGGRGGDGGRRNRGMGAGVGQVVEPAAVGIVAAHVDRSADPGVAIPPDARAGLDVGAPPTGRSHSARREPVPPGKVALGTDLGEGAGGGRHATTPPEVPSASDFAPQLAQRRS